MALQHVPVLLIAYRRPDLTARVLARVAAARPQRLYVALDGPASPAVAEDCRAVRALVTQLDWPDCEVQLNVSKDNLGCAERVRTALDWVFAHEEQALIVEDDTLPGVGWFPWAERMLDRYKDDPSVGMVSARNPLIRWPATGRGHLKSRFSLIWGWGTWADRWQAHRNTHGSGRGPDPSAVERRWADVPEIATFRAFLAATDAGQRLDTWDVAWAVGLEAAHLSNIVPASNWVENLGFDARGTHLTAVDDVRGGLPGLAPNAPDELQDAGEFDVLCIMNELMCNGALHAPRRWKMLARNAARVPRPGADAAWAALLLPFTQPERTIRLVDHLLAHWVGPLPEPLLELDQTLRP